MLRKLPFPILLPSADGFDCKNAYNPSVIYRKGKFVMLYRGECEDGKTGRIGLAISEDGINFTKFPEPVIEPEYSWEAKGVEDPRVVKLGKKYVMTYTGYDGKVARLCLATSKNLLSWKKHGPIFDDFPENYLRPREWTKSGAILPVKVNGRYIMYFGDSNIWIAYSKDGKTWEYSGKPILRPGNLLLVEPGPPPLLTKEGIVLFYNSADKSLVYKVRVAVFDKKNPERAIWKSENTILEPEYPWEKFGHVNNVVFLEGLVEDNERTLFYYGAADRYVGLAMWKGSVEMLLQTLGFSKSI
ncbi:glycoside hydrolase family 130 protein [Pyrococcus kukulkanii]|uniref:glycoside hydrolase family 130 protein n=1 Tax=Pyrococcus kukulkanii TaxID=1609559 RepID=UPI00356B40B9